MIVSSFFVKTKFVSSSGSEFISEMYREHKFCKQKSITTLMNTFNK